MLGTDALYERPTLLELSERGSMKPYILSRRVHLSLQRFYRLTLTTPHLTHFLVENTGNGNANEVDIDTEIIHYDSVLGVNVNVSINYYFSTSIARRRRFRVSSFPKKAEMSNMPGPLPIPTNARRKAFITSPSL